MIEIGVSGTRDGATAEQIKSAVSYINHIFDPGAKFHHGCCIGVDEQLSIAAHAIGYKLIAHPPLDNRFMSTLSVLLSDEVNKPIDYIERNKQIVRASDRMLILPKNFGEQIRSGTWATYRYSIIQEVPTMLIHPDGSTKWLMKITHSS